MLHDRALGKQRISWKRGDYTDLAKTSGQESSDKLSHTGSLPQRTAVKQQCVLLLRPDKPQDTFSAMPASFNFKMHLVGHHHRQQQQQQNKKCSASRSQPASPKTANKMLDPKRKTSADSGNLMVTGDALDNNNTLLLRPSHSSTDIPKISLLGSETPGTIAAINRRRKQSAGDITAHIRSKFRFGASSSKSHPNSKTTTPSPTASPDVDCPLLLINGREPEEQVRKIGEQPKEKFLAVPSKNPLSCAAAVFRTSGRKRHQHSFLSQSRSRLAASSLSEISESGRLNGLFSRLSC